MWQPPRPHGEQPPERVVGPLELFYDRAVVVLVAQAAHRLAGHLTWRGVGEFAVVFTLVWMAWTNGSLHHELHGHDDARARSTFLVQILVRRAGRLFVTGTAACAVLLAGTALLPAGARVPAWGLLDAAYLTGFAAVIIRARPPPTAALMITGALTERFGAFTIIVLGETLTGVVARLSGQPVSGLTLGVGLVAVGGLRRLVDVLRLRRAPPPEAGTRGQPAVDARSPAAYGRCRRTAASTGPRPGARSPPRPPLGTRRDAPPGQRCRLSRLVYTTRARAIPARPGEFTAWRAAPRRPGRDRCPWRRSSRRFPGSPGRASGSR